MINVKGTFKMSGKQPTNDQLAYLNAFTNSFRVTRHPDWVESDISKYLREVNGLPIGKDGAFIIDYANIVTPHFEEAKTKIFSPHRHDITPPDNQPSNVCSWVIDGDEVVWSECVDVYKLVDWITYLIDRFFNPWKIILNGSIEFSNSAESSQCGTITVVNNSIFSTVE